MAKEWWEDAPIADGNWWDAAPLAKDEPRPYRDRVEALDDAVNFIEEGQPLANVAKSFGSVGLTEQDILSHGKQRGSELFANSLQTTGVAPDSSKSLKIFEPTATQEFLTNPLKRGMAAASRTGDILAKEAGVIGNETAAGLVARRNKAIQAAAPGSDIQASQEAISKAGEKGLSDAAVALARNPAATWTMLLESVVSSAPSIATSVAGSIFGPIGSAVGAGLGSFATEYGSTVFDSMAETGLNPANPADIQKAFENPEVMSAARSKAAKRGIAVASFDALTAGLAGRFFKPAMGKVQIAKEINGGSVAGLGAGRVLASASAKEAGVQAAGGMAGEALAQGVTDGKLNYSNILLEGLAELPGGAVEVAQNMAFGGRDQKAMSFTPANSITRQAGLPEIVVPIKEQPGNVSLRDAPPGLVGESSQQTSAEPVPSVGDLRPGADNGGRGNGDGAGGVAPADGALAPIRDASGQPIAFVEGDPLVRSRDGDLLSRAEAQAPQAEPSQPQAPVTIWAGRAGDGYADLEAAQAGLQTRIKRDPDLRWEVEQMPSGKYRLAGYDQTQAVNTQQGGVQGAANVEQMQQEAPSDSPAEAQRGLVSSEVNTAQFPGAGSNALEAAGVDVAQIDTGQRGLSADVLVNKQNPDTVAQSVQSSANSEQAQQAVKAAVTASTQPISPKDARSLVAGKTEKPGGVDPVTWIHDGREYRVGDVPLDLFVENEEAGRYDGTVNAGRAANYASRNPEGSPPVIATQGRYGGKLRIIDGGHRISAARMRGDTTIKAIVRVKPETGAERPLDMRLIPASKRAEYAASIGQSSQPVPIQPAPVMTDKPDGTMSVTGDPKALKQQLIDSGIPSQSIMKSKTGVLIGRSQVARVRDILSPPQSAPSAGIRKEDIPKAVNLSAEYAAIEDRFRQKLAADFDGAVREYSALPQSNGGKILNVDDAREFSPDYLKDRTKSAAVHEPASWFIKQLYARKLAEPLKPGESPIVLFTAGGTGAGKTTGIQSSSVLQSISDRAHIIYDTNMNGRASSIAKIDQAREAGMNVHIVLVVRDPVDALVNGALPRAERQRKEFGTGRTVPVAEHIKTHKGAVQTVRQLAVDYADNPMVKIDVLDNSFGKAKAQERSIDWLGSIQYDGVESKVLTALENEYENGRISEGTYRGFAGNAQKNSAAEARSSSPGANRPVLNRSTEGVSARPERGNQQAVTKPGLTADEAQAAVESITSKWANAPEVVVVQDMQDGKVPAAVRAEDAKQRSQDAQGDPEGFYHSGKVYLVSSAIDSRADVQRVLFHEALGHAGLRGVFGKALNPILEGIAITRSAEVRAKAKQYGLDFSNPQQRLAAAEEVLAEMAQTRPELGFVKRAVAAIRTWLRANVPGFSKLKVSDDEIIQKYLIPARGFVERGQKAAAGDSGSTRFARAYHGSPHRFDKFKLDKIGTGEGAQAYGHGLYFASNKEIAEHYRTTLQKNMRDWSYKIDGKEYTRADHDAFIAAAMAYSAQEYGPVDKAWLNDQLGSRGPYDASRTRSLYKQFSKNRVYRASGGQLYEVEIPDDTEMLWWEKPLSEQPEKVRAALGAAQEKVAQLTDKNGPVNRARDAVVLGSGTGEQLYSRLASVFAKPEPAPSWTSVSSDSDGRAWSGQKAASDYLASLGIRGIKYLDGSSRADGDGSYNYVIFSDDDVQIEKTYFSRQRGATDGMATSDVVGEFQGGRSADDNTTGASAQTATDESTGLPLNADGTVTVYHHTSAAAAAAIRKSGQLKSQAEPDVYVTTHKQADTGYGDTAIAIRVKPSRLVIDDEFPGGRTDYRIDVGRPGGSIEVTVENESTTPTSDGVPRFSRSQDTIEVDGIQRPRTNSKGQPIHPTEDGVRNFWRWFKDSKVVDAAGRPMVVYHGTSADFDAFNPESIGKNFTASTLGFYFTNAASPNMQAGFGEGSTASEYAKNSSGSPNVMPVYLALDNPLILGDATDWGGPVAALDFQRSDIARWLRNEGRDGVIYQDDSGEEKEVAYVARRPEQIKSATGNQGAFDAANADIRFSRSTMGSSAQGQRFTLPEDGATAITRIKLQDDALRMKRVIDAVKEQGGTVGEEQNFYDANTLMPGRVQSMMDGFRNDAVLPMLKKAAKADISMDELSLYAYARHAEERNAYIASINPKMQDGGSGMTNADAQAIMAEFEKSGKAAEYEDLHGDLMGITAATRRTMLDDGLITQEQYDAMEAQYENYMPLRGFENVEPETGVARPGVGRGINVRGKETIRALGRRSRAGDLIENVIRDYQRAVVKSEKNNVGKVFLDFVLSNQDPDLWGVDVEKGKATLNKATGQVEYGKTVDKGEDTVGVKVAGQQVYIQIKDKALARAMRHAWKDETGDLERAAVAVSGWYNTLLRNVLTRYNPPFAIVNTIRDAQSGAVAALDELGAKGAKRFAFYYPKAVAASYRGERGWGTGTIFNNPVMDKYFNEFKESGAITGGFFMKDLGDIASDLRSDLLQAGAAPKSKSERVRASLAFKVSKKLLGALEFMGTVSENTTRFALYMAARDSGRTPSEAALLAKNGTTNFNRKGEWGGTLNALYLFFNAAVQGNAQLFKTLKNPKVRAALSVVAGVGVAAAMFGASGGGEDDDGQAYWDKIPDYEKERNLIIMLPPGDTLGRGVERVGQYGRYIKIPVQYGLNFFPNIGYMMADVYRNQQDPSRGKTIAKATQHMLSVTFGSVNPFGGSVDVTDSVSLAMAVAPTLLDLPIMLGTENNSFGSPVAPSRFPGDTKPDSERMFASDIDTLPANIAKALNDLGGGNEAKPGKILGIETSVTPGTIENLIRATTGGLGMFGVQSWDVVADVYAYFGPGDGVRRKGLEPSNWPVFNKVYGEVGQSQNIRMAGERMREVRDVSKLIDDQLKSGIAPDVSDDEKKILALSSAQETYQKEMTRLRKEEVAVLRSPDMADERKRLALDNIRAAQDALSVTVNRAYLKQLGPIKESEMEVSK